MFSLPNFTHVPGPGHSSLVLQALAGMSISWQAPLVLTYLEYFAGAHSRVFGIPFHLTPSSWSARASTF